MKHKERTMARRATTGNSKKSSGKSAWAKARDTTKDDKPFGEAVPFEAGTYTMQIVRATVYKDESKGSMLRTEWCALDEDDYGVIGTLFEGPCEEPDRLVWIQRTLATLGVDLDEVDYDEPSDLEAIYNELIEENVCAKVRVTEKDGYRNMRIGKEVEVDEDLLVDPASVFGDNSSGGEKKGSKKKQQEEEEEEEEELEDAFVDGDEVEFKKGRKTEQGTVVGYDEDGNVLIKVGKKQVAMPEDKVSLLESEEPEEEEPEEPEETEETVEITWDTIEVGDKVIVDFGEEDGTLDAIVTSKPPRGKKKNEIQVTVDGEDDPEMITIDMITEVLESEEAEETEEEEEEESSLEFDVGDEVEFKKGRKKVTGTIKKLDDETATIKVAGQRTLEKISIDDLSHVIVE